MDRVFPLFESYWLNFEKYLWLYLENVIYLQESLIMVCYGSVV